MKKSELRQIIREEIENNTSVQIKKFIKSNSNFLFHSEEGIIGNVIELEFISDENCEGENAGVEDVIEAENLKNSLLKSEFSKNIEHIKTSIDRSWVTLNIKLL